jgi:hypothetical protein
MSNTPGGGLIPSLPAVVCNNSTENLFNEGGQTVSPGTL